MLSKKQSGVKPGDVVTVDGQVEYIGQGYSDKFKTDLPIPELNAKRVEVKESNKELPKPIVLGK
jgi:hypothetical protein